MGAGFTDAPGGRLLAGDPGWRAGLEIAALGATQPSRKDASTRDAMDEVTEETGRTIPQIALNWLLQRPTVATVLIGARNEEQLRQNLGAVGWNLSAEQVSRLDAASAVIPPYPYYPYWRGQFSERNPAPVASGASS